MESPRAGGAETPGPTDRDRENAAMREAIAERLRAEYAECLRWAMGRFGPGWVPGHRHDLIDKDDEERCRRTGERPTPAATVYTARNADGGRRHFMVDAAGRVTEVSGYEEGFGDMLSEPHPTRGFTHKGEFVHVHRYSLCWAGYELYHPRSADQLASLRQSRERGKEERADAAFLRDNPLLAQAGITRKDLEPE